MAKRPLGLGRGYLKKQIDSGGSNHTIVGVNRDRAISHVSVNYRGTATRTYRCMMCMGCIHYSRDQMIELIGYGSHEGMLASNYSDSLLNCLELSAAGRVGGDADPIGDSCWQRRVLSEFRGPRSELGEGGRAVSLMVALLSCHLALREHVPLSSCCSGRQVRASEYG